MSSKTSLGMGSGLDGQGSAFDSGILTAEGGVPPGEVLYDTIAYLIYCEEHKKVGLTQAIKNGRIRSIWFPFVALSPIGTWSDKAEEGIQLILREDNPELEGRLGLQPKVPVTVPKRIYIQRIQVPFVHKFVTRLMYFVKIENTSDFKCCEKTKRIQWYPVVDVLKHTITELWAPEVEEFTSMVELPKNNGMNEYTIRKAFRFTDEVNREGDNENIFKRMGFENKEKEIIYSQYLEHCFPSHRMSFQSFKECLIKYGITFEDQIFQMLFRAFDIKYKGFVEFSDFLLGIMVMDPNSPQEIYRYAFIFRFYGTNKCLNFKEFKRLMSDNFKDQNQAQINNKVKEIMESTPTEVPNQFTFQEWMKAIRSKRFNTNVSPLCRLKDSIIKKILNSESNHESLGSAKETSNLMGVQTNKESVCSRCRPSNYEYALHSVMLDSIGRCTDCRLINPVDERKGLKIRRSYSMKFTFSSDGVIAYLLDTIRGFNLKKDKSNEKGLLAEESRRTQLMSYIKRLSNALELIFSSEERVIRINSPVYVLGSLYANLDNLIAMESILWPSFPVISSNYVFLGNYVDSGKWGIETILYLFSLKVLSPNKIFLLRGRHEFRDIQIQNTFKDECFVKYGDQLGLEVWKTINNLFDRMPFALIIDETIFCANSGIPNTTSKVKTFTKVSPIIKNASVESQIVWQIVTNEPTLKPLETGTGFSDEKGISTRFVFNDKAVKDFLERNGFSHVICGNRPSPNGYDFYFGAKFINVFSSTTRDNNKFAALLIANTKITVIRMEGQVIPTKPRASEYNTKNNTKKTETKK